MRFLYQRHDKIKYQYDIMDNVLLLRILKDKYSKNIDTISINRLFHFDIDDYNSSLATNQCDIIFSTEEMIQCNIRLVDANTPNKNGYLAYMLSQFEKALKKLPGRSPLLGEDLPIIEENALEFMGSSYSQETANCSGQK